MVNRYIDFVKKYAKDNNLLWNCAVCEIKTNNLYVTQREAKKAPSKAAPKQKAAPKAKSKPMTKDEITKRVRQDNAERRREMKYMLNSQTVTDSKKPESKKPESNLNDYDLSKTKRKKVSGLAAPKATTNNEVKKAYDEYADKMKAADAYMYKTRAFTPGTTDLRQLGVLKDNYNIAVKKAGLKNPKKLPGLSGKRRPFYNVHEFKSKKFLIDAINEYLLKKKIKISDLTKQSLHQLIDGIIQRELDVDSISKIYNRKIEEAMEPFWKNADDKDKRDKLSRLSILGGRL